MWSCLAALPADLRLELERTYAEQSHQSTQRPNKVVDQSDIHPLMRIKQKWSPIKGPPNKSPRKSSRKSPGKSPKHIKKQSPIFKVPQDWRDKNLNPKKLEFGTGHKHNEKVEEIKGNSSSNKQLPHRETYASSQPDPVNLAGAVTLAEVKMLMKDWIKSSPRAHNHKRQDSGLVGDYGTLAHIAIMGDLNVKLPLASKIQGTISIGADVNERTIIHAYRMEKYNKEKTRPILVKFHHPLDRQIAWKHPSTLADKIHLRQEYPEHIANKRKILQHIVNYARNTKSYKDNAYLKHDRLVVKDKRYSLETLSALPPEVQISVGCSESNDVLYFYGIQIPLSNFYPTTFSYEGTTLNCLEQRYFYLKAQHYDETELAFQIPNETRPNFRNINRGVIWDKRLG
ncbi:hypothetical protein LSH36_138g06004 [Paralvinella palmiformis]|uniref:Uncharacterized protein n=1 Tax=Paralvinella palmiformis TaxID=53620 RepID=A0AAD9NAL7_9ANNE|nr:hypothetical protein LSH36_138g06004 [Paralvinella palmiformis]